MDSGVNQRAKNCTAAVANGCGAHGASVFCPTNASGVATIDLVITRQPGDNFAVAAGASPIEVNGVNVNGIELSDSGGQTVATESCPTQTVCRSQMLTVWRRLHIEVDSMAPSAENWVEGTVTTTTRIRVGQTVTVPVNPTFPPPGGALEINRFEGGRFVSNFRSFPVVSNTANTVTITGTGTTATLFAGDSFRLYDDDDFNDNDGTLLDGDTGEDIPGPDDPSVSGTALLQPNDILCSQTVTSGCNEVVLKGETRVLLRVFSFG